MGWILRSLNQRLMPNPDGPAYWIVGVPIGLVENHTIATGWASYGARGFACVGNLEIYARHGKGGSLSEFHLCRGSPSPNHPIKELIGVRLRPRDLDKRSGRGSNVTDGG